MRCLACNNALNEEQTRKKMPVCGEHWDLCGGCLRAIRIGFGMNIDPVAKPMVSLGVRSNLDEARACADMYLRERGYDMWGRHMMDDTDG